MSSLSLGDTELRQILQSLTRSLEARRESVLKKAPPGTQDVRITDVFTFNAHFTHSKASVHIPSVPRNVCPFPHVRLRDSRLTLTFTHQSEAGANELNQVAQAPDHQYALDAAIVRVMKSQRTLSYKRLETAVTDSVSKSFTPSRSMVKERVEELVNKEYLRIDENRNHVLHYVA